MRVQCLTNGSTNGAPLMDVSGAKDQRCRNFCGREYQLEVLFVYNCSVTSNYPETLKFAKWHYNPHFAKSTKKRKIRPAERSPWEYFHRHGVWWGKWRISSICLLICCTSRCHWTTTPTPGRRPGVGVKMGTCDEYGGLVLKGLYLNPWDNYWVYHQLNPMRIG